MKKLIASVSALILVAFAGPLWAGNLKLVNNAEMDIKEKGKNGEEIVKRVPATKVVPGTEVIYTTIATNEEKVEAANVVITNPVPDHMVYVAGSAISSAMGSATKITYSIDGTNFDVPEKLEVIEEDGTVRKATAEDYKAIRWLCNFSIKPQGKVTVSFRARLK